MRGWRCKILGLSSIILTNRLPVIFIILPRDLHMGIGGSWDCKVDLGEVARSDEALAPILGALSIRLMQLYNSLWGNGTLKCPADCAAESNFEDCLCTCPEVDALSQHMQPAGLNWTQSHDILSESGVVHSLRSFLLPHAVGEEEEGGASTEGRKWVQFDGLSLQQSKEMWQLLLDVACHPGKLGNMATGASSGDPIFWPLHPTFDRLWNYMLLDR